MLKEIYFFINHTTAPLYKVIFSTNYFFIDFWSFVHLINGILIIFFLKRFNFRRPFYILMIVLSGWEIIEISFIYFSIKVFNPETIPDQFTDIFIGLLGGLFAWHLRLLGKIVKNSLINYFKSIEAIISCSMSFVWVGFYNYRYNIEFFNSPFVNWLAFILWSTGLFLTLKLYKSLGNYFSNIWMRLIATWLIYFPSLLIIEYFGYYVFKIRQVTSEEPLIFGLIHGTIILKFYYIFAGILAIFIYNYLQHILIMPLSRVARQESYRYKQLE